MIGISADCLHNKENRRFMDRKIIRWCLFLAWLLLAPLLARAAEPAPTLVVRESGTALYPRQDSETEPVARLKKDETLFPLIESIGTEVWYMVRTKQGLLGWVRAVDVVAGSHTRDAFKEKESGASTWFARTADGKVFTGSWSLAPDPSSKSASGAWTLIGPDGAVLMRGTWSADKHTTGWNGVWRATVEGRSGEYTGSWSAELSHVRNAPFTELFQAAAKQAVAGLWTGGHQAGSWSIRAGE